MTAYLQQYRTAVYEHIDDHGEGWGSGSYLRLGNQTFILTNEHVAQVRSDERTLAYQLKGQEDIRRIVGGHIEFPAPLDLALLPVPADVWSNTSNESRAIEIDQIALCHAPVQTELLTFSGFSGSNVAFHFDTLLASGTCSTAREAELPADDDRFASRFHFGIDYRPDLASTVIGDKSLPLPPGLSGSTVWNTGFVEAKMHGVTWTPEFAKVTDVVWGWPSNHGCLVATRAEYLRSFLLGAQHHSDDLWIA
ncbi:Uncharacterised protein [Burkholderia cepacia]|uniref:Trypsin-like peptidase domain-containing protein n=2 Tax=Burkholderia cepacia TaxID=292 RepID=A0AAE8NEF7_BURCE|nr:hypothetical protein CSX04_08357 [Burkholderia cepacia]SPV19711.1 Uncharacterised protein [Burkholderia cepacia]